MSKIIIINGLPGTGKTTLVEKLADKLEVPYFTKDDFKEILGDTIGFSNHEDTKYFGKMSFSALYLIAKRIISAGEDLIIEGNFTAGEETEEFRNFLLEKGVEVREIFCITEPIILKERLLGRSRHPVHNTLSTEEMMNFVLRVTGGEYKCKKFNVSDVYELDTTHPEVINYSKIYDFVQNKF